MLVPIASTTAAAPPRRPRWPVIVLLVLLVLLAGGGALLVTNRDTRATAVALQRRSQWQAALVAAGAPPDTAQTVLAHNDRERVALAAALEFGITDTLALAVMEQESGGDAGVISPAGARGLFQVMPATGVGIAEALGVRDFTPTMLDDPTLNARFGMYYLERQINRFGLTWGLAAYNWGPTNVADLLASVPAARTLSWDAVCQQYGQAIPIETQQYVANILAIWSRLERTRVAAALPATPTTGVEKIAFPITNTQGTLTLTVHSVVRAAGTVTVAVRLENAGPVLLATSSTLRVTAATGEVYTLPEAWGAHPLPARGSLDMQLICTPVPNTTASLIVTAQIAQEAPLAIGVPLPP